MSDPFTLAWIADGDEPTENDLAPAEWKHPATGPLQTLDDVVAYLVAADWPDGFKPWVRKPDGSVLNPLEVIGYLPE